MLTIENAQVFGFQAAIRGMRNPKNSWAKSDSTFELSTDESGVQMIDLGPADRKLAAALANSGPDDGKFLRMVHVQLDVTAPLYWWKEADQYKVGISDPLRDEDLLPVLRGQGRGVRRELFGFRRAVHAPVSVCDTVFQLL